MTRDAPHPPPSAAHLELTRGPTPWPERQRRRRQAWAGGKNEQAGREPGLFCFGWKRRLARLQFEAAAVQDRFGVPARLLAALEHQVAGGLERNAVITRRHR